MPKKHRNLIERIASPESMRAAYARAAHGKRRSGGYLEFKEHAHVHLASIRAAMKAGTYQPAPHRVFEVLEPKRRVIHAPRFRDRVVQHAMHGVLEPIFDAMFSSRSYACRREKGTHHGVTRLQADLRSSAKESGEVYFLKTDFRSYFHSIDREVLWAIIRKKIGCKPTLALIAEYLPETGKGVPIGALLSQLWANLYGHQMDRLIVARGHRRWHRYMDDVVIIESGGRDAAEKLLETQQAMQQYAKDSLGLEFSKWSIQPVTRGVNFLGYRVWATHKLLRKRSVVRAKRKIRSMSGRGDAIALERFLGSWMGHASHADSANLMRHLGITKQTA